MSVQINSEAYKIILISQNWLFRLARPLKQLHRKRNKILNEIFNIELILIKYGDGNFFHCHNSVIYQVGI